VSPHPLVIGHRGARNLWPENSLSGFARTLELGVDGVEFDIHPTTDGKFAVHHDATLERTTEAHGPIAALSAAEVAAVRLKDAEGETVPLLDPVLDLLAPSGVELHLEIKADAEGNPYPGLEEAVVAAVKPRRLGRQLVLTSFWPEVHERLRAADPEMRLLVSINTQSLQRLGGGLDRLIDRLERSRVELYAVEKALLAARQDDFVGRLGWDRLGVWVTNEEADIRRWTATPVRQLTTDRPDLCLSRR
jgi:glycerophosphoryl diester phosphodiesterase